VEFSGVILIYGDRYILQFIKGSTEVGLYSAGYNLSAYCSQLLIVPLGLSIQPSYMKIWANEGRTQTKEFLNKSLKYFLMAVIPIIFGLFSIGKELLVFLASEKYLRAYPILTIITAGILFYGSTNILGAGLYIKKKTFLISLMMLCAGIMNVILNFVLIPNGVY
jgi:O-antigen/teichoic acid export membrane protein